MTGWVGGSGGASCFRGRASPVLSIIERIKDHVTSVFRVICRLCIINSSIDVVELAVGRILMQSVYLDHIGDKIVCKNSLETSSGEKGSLTFEGKLSLSFLGWLAAAL